MRAPLPQLLAALALLALFSCASEQRYKEMTDAWVGKSTKELMKTWGQPHASFQLMGNQVLVYDQLQPGPNFAGVDPRAIPAERCTTYFEVDKGRVVAVGYKGNACVK